MATDDGARAAFRRLLTRRDGGSTVEFIVLLAPLLALLFFVIEVSVFFYHSESVRKAAEVGARFAIVSPPAVSGLPATNGLADGAEEGHCGLDPSPCEPPTPQRWRCSGGADPACTDAFGSIVTEMRRYSPGITAENVTVTYVYSQLGRAGGPFVPSVIVDVEDVANPLGVFGLRQLFFGGGRFRNAPDARATFVAEDLS